MEHGLQRELEGTIVALRRQVQLLEAGTRS